MPDDHGMLTTYLAERDSACPLCAYNLRGLTGSRCPECNQELVLTVGLVERVDRAWVVGLVGLASGAGFFDLLVGMMIVVSVHERDWPPMRLVWPLCVSAVLLPIVLIWWIRNRAALRRSAASTRRRQAALCWVLTLGSAIGCLAWIIHYG